MIAMCPPVYGVRAEESQITVNFLTSSSQSTDCMYDLRERNYLGFSECSSVGNCTMSPLSLYSKDTELRLGLPGSHSPERDTQLSLLSSPKLDEKPLFPLFSPQSVLTRSKRGFSDTEGVIRLKLDPSSIQESPTVTTDTTQNHSYAANYRCNVLSPKEQVVGWPPIKGSVFMKTTTGSGPKAAAAHALVVKVSMDGVVYLRKVDLSTFNSYQGLTSALENLFASFIIGKHEYLGAHGEKHNEMKLKNLLNSSGYVVAYLDKFDHWMRLGDIPWEIFVGDCKRLRILKSSAALGLQGF